MSTYWFYYCRDCDSADSDNQINHGEKHLAARLELFRLVATFPYTLPDDIGISSHIDRLHGLNFDEFLSAHYQHNVMLESEYGERRFHNHFLDKISADLK